MSLLKLVGVLLDYPQDELWKHGDELLAAAGDTGLPPARREDLVRFVRELLAADALDAQDRWLQTFDRGRSMSLLLFEHIRSEEHTSELQSLMRISYAVFCLKKKKKAQEQE